LLSDELPFINAKIGGSLLDFEGNLDFEDSFHHWYKNKARGQVGELPVGKDYKLSMQWEVGKAVPKD